MNISGIVRTSSLMNRCLLMMATISRSVGAKVILAFTLAVGLGFLGMIVFQAETQTRTLVNFVTQNLIGRTHQLANAIRDGVLVRNDSAVLNEYKPIADAPNSQTAGIAVFDADGTPFLQFVSRAPLDITLGAILGEAPGVLAKGDTVTFATRGQIVVVCPVTNHRGDKIVGALAIAWSLDRENAAVAAARQDQALVALIAMVALLGLLAGVLQILIVRPLTRMTAAMAMLAAGQTEVIVPDLGRDDEIGRMASATAVFKQNAEALRESEARYRHLMEHLIEGVCQSSGEGRVLLANQALADMLGYDSPADLIDNIHDLSAQVYADPEERGALLRALVQRGQVRDFELRMRRKDGAEIIGSLSATAAVVDGRVVYLEGMMTDVTARRQAETRILAFSAELEARVQARTEELERTLLNLQRMQDELIRAEKLAGLGALVAGIAHEINTPLGNSLTVATALRDKATKFREQVDQGALKRSELTKFLDELDSGTDIAQRSLERAAALVRKFKTVAVDQVSEKRRAFDCGQVTEEVVATLHPMIKHRDISITADLPRGIVLDSFPGPYGQIITNLVANAVIHGFDDISAGIIHISARMVDAETVSVAVSDNGKGIPASIRPKIFDPFFTTRFGQGGSGLGLHLVYQMATRILGGTVVVDSVEGKGTTFTLTLPMIAPAAVAQGKNEGRALSA